MTRSIILMLGLMLTFGTVAWAQDKLPIRSISVAGTVETKTAPDQIMWRINLKDAHKDMREAKARSDEKVKSVVALREKLDIGEGDLETGTVSIRREYERDKHGNRGEFKHFVLSRSVTIRQRDLKRFDEFLDAFVASAEMEVSFGFASSRVHEVRAETRLKALQTAKAKANDMARVVGARLGRVLAINEHAPGGGSRHLFSNTTNMEQIRANPKVDQSSKTFVPGAISMRVTVYATFELE